MDIYIHMYIYIHIQSGVYMYIHVYIYIHIYVSSFWWMHIYICTYIHTYIHIHIHTTYMNVYIYKYTHTHIHAHTDLHTHTHTRTHTHTHKHESRMGGLSASLCVWHDSFICVTWPIHMCDTIQSDVWHDSFICDEACLIHMYDMNNWYNTTLYVFMVIICMIHFIPVLPCWYNTTLYIFTDMTTIIYDSCHTCENWYNTTHSRVRHESFIWQPMTYSYVWHDPFICVTRFCHMCDMTHSYVTKHASFICMT